MEKLHIWLRQKNRESKTNNDASVLPAADITSSSAQASERHNESSDEGSVNNTHEEIELNFQVTHKPRMDIGKIKTCSKEGYQSKNS